MLTVGENGVHRPSCVTVVYFLLKKMKIHIHCML